MNRREFLKTAALAGLYGALHPLQRAFPAKDRQTQKMIVLGIDGMDPHLAMAYLNKGLLPNFRKLVEIGGINRVMPNFPPQSPVAWSSLSVGAGPEVHGIYDFIHRNPVTMAPYHSTSRVNRPTRSLSLGKWSLPLARGSVDSLRLGRPFWEDLADGGIPVTVFKMPANFPCRHRQVRMVSGMGTPDLRGGYGNFTLFTTSGDRPAGNITGGRVVQAKFNGQRSDLALPGPVNHLLKSHPETAIPFQVWRDHRNEVVRLRIQKHEVLLKRGEWTGWLALTFPMMPYFAAAQGICKFLLKSVHPDFELYVSPINIDPSDPALPVVSTREYGQELVDKIGFFYTQGLPADTNALSAGVLDDLEFMQLDTQIVRERRAILDYETRRLLNLKEGFLFFYFSNLDQSTHMFWRMVDPQHPLYDPKTEKKFGQVLMNMYMEMDHILGDVLERFDIADPRFRLLVMSDHGFAPFRRQVNLNTWLFQKGYLQLKDARRIESDQLFENVDWNRTAAYALGINALYLNLEGREKTGILTAGQAKTITARLKRDLLQLTDPVNGAAVVSRVAESPEAIWRRQPQAPDLIIGWNRGYRTSWESILGGFSRHVVRDNEDKWSGDHCIDPSLVPAVLFSNRPVENRPLRLTDITATIVTEFGLSVPTSMDGSPLLA